MNTEFIRKSIGSTLDRNVAVREAHIRKWAHELPAGSKVLDVGAGTCSFRADFAHCSYVAQDHPLSTMAPPGVEVVRSDINSIPLDANSIDAILCSEVFEHIEDPYAAVSEMFRLLRPGGKLLLTVPAACRIHPVPTHFWGGFAPDFFNVGLSRRGFTIDNLTPVGNWSDFMAQELSRMPDVLRRSFLPFQIGKALGLLSWPTFRLAIPLLLKSLAAVDASQDLPLGWVCAAHKSA